MDFDLGFDSTLNFDPSAYGVSAPSFNIPDLQSSWTWSEPTYSLGFDSRLDDPTRGWPGYNFNDEGGYDLGGNYSGYTLGAGGLNVGMDSSVPGVPSFQEPAPSLGQPSGSSGGERNWMEDDNLWKKTRGYLDRGVSATRSGLDTVANAITPETPGTKMLAGLGSMVAGPLVNAAMKAAFQPGQPKQRSTSPGLPQAPAGGQAYQTAPLEPLPGTGASPLISGGPTSLRPSQGLRKPWGGMTIY